MFGSFARGIVGAAFTAGAVIVFIAVVSATHSIGMALIIAGAIWVFGAYLTYVSRQSVRIRR
jgi:hypothetical protein